MSDVEGKSTFQLVKNDPAFSGIKRRKYDVDNPEIEEIIVELKRLDDIINPEVKIDFIKIDVEGGEYGVLRGAQRVIQQSKPIIIFECGLGASDYYGVEPGQMYDLITDILGLPIYTLISFIQKDHPLSKSGFENLYNSNKEYYFAAALIK